MSKLLLFVFSTLFGLGLGFSIGLSIPLLEEVLPVNSLKDFFLLMLVLFLLLLTAVNVGVLINELAKKVKA